MADPGNAWYRREAFVADRFWRARCYFDDRFADGQVIGPDDDPGHLAGTPVLWRTDVDERQRLVITVSDWAAPDAPDVWYVSIVRPRNDPPTASLVAYPTEHLAPGTVIADAEFFGLPVRNDAQVGAIRWFTHDACIEQLFIAPEMRRHHLASKVIYAASAFHQANGWPGRLHSDGRRTDLGQQLAAGSRHRQRVAPWTHRMASMDTDDT